MWTEKRIIEYLKENLKGTRLEHTLSVRDTAIKLAEIYGEDVEKARIAALIHDCAKYIDYKEMLNIIEKCGYNNMEADVEIKGILHAPVGACLAKTIMGVEDEDILNAIIYHTTGRKNMSLLEKIIYLADYIEPHRNFPGVDEVREVAYKEDLDKALLISLNKTIKYIIEKGQLLHINTVEARNYLLQYR
jgi:predicted HD superfamily hydrolase involved in NAD metabolism